MPDIEFFVESIPEGPEEDSNAMAGHRIPTCVVLDFYDSYTRNILCLFEQLENIVCSGGKGKAKQWDISEWQRRAVIVNVDSVTWDSFACDVLPHADCIILGPGPGSPHKKSDFSWPARLIQEYGDKVPILGICLGLQGMATAFGAQVIRGHTPVHGQVTHIQHSGDALFAGIPSQFEAVQFNSLVVDRRSIPNDLDVIAVSKAGEIMAMKHGSKPIWGVQFHPESICSTFGATLLSNFLNFSLSARGKTEYRDSSPSFPQAVLALSTCHQAPASRHSAPSKSKYRQQSVKIPSEAWMTPQYIYEHLVKGKSTVGEVWLDSARPSGQRQFSHMSNSAYTLSYSLSSRNIVRRDATSNSTQKLEGEETFFDHLRDLQASLHASTEFDQIRPCSIPIGFTGYFGYEMKAESLPHCQPREDPDISDAEFGFSNRVLTFDHETSQWWASGLISNANTASISGQDNSDGLSEDKWTSWLARIQTFFRHPPKRVQAESTVALNSFSPDVQRNDYIEAIERAQKLISAGESYELCLTTQFRSTLPSSLADDPFPLYLALRESNPAPYGAYFRLPQSDLAIMSSSPERFMSLNKDGLVEMKPIKGTVQRSSDPAEDDKRKLLLEKDEKERAENLMIVDLCRNDLLGFCEVESVKVPKLMKVETYQTVYQLVTSVQGRLKPHVNAFGAVRGAFPPGSMTGAPKVRSVKLLEELENHQPRGVYSGVFGYVAVDGAADLSVIIRTLIARKEQLTLGAGGAITHLSQPSKEWEEVLVKKEAVLRAL